MRDEKTATLNVNRNFHGKKLLSTENAMHEVMRFLEAQDRLPDIPFQMDALVQNLENVMDDELIQGLDAMEKHWCYSQEGRTSKEERDLVYPVRELLDRLRELQKARLRDAIARLVQKHPN